jgi:hypothetical protein
LIPRRYYNPSFSKPYWLIYYFILWLPYSFSSPEKECTLSPPRESWKPVDYLSTREKDLLYHIFEKKRNPSLMLCIVYTSVFLFELVAMIGQSVHYVTKQNAPFTDFILLVIFIFGTAMFLIKSISSTARYVFWYINQ